MNLKKILSVVKNKVVAKHWKVGNSNVTVGAFTYGHESIQINQWDEGANLEIGGFCSIASNVTIFLGGNHRVDWITTYPFGHIFTTELGIKKFEGHPSTKGDVIIGNDVWIGSGVTILSGITIGDGAVISANATVTKNVKSYHIVGGNPANIIKKRFNDEIIKLLLELKWWDLPLKDIMLIKDEISSQPNVEKILKLINEYK